jgi:hypothetical protein
MKGEYGPGLDVDRQQPDNIDVVAVADEDGQGRAAAALRLGPSGGFWFSFGAEKGLAR